VGLLSVEFDTPINRILAQQQPKNKFRIDTSLPDLSFLRQLSVQGRLRFNRGSGATTITITPPTGETLFFYGGLFGSGAAAASTFTIKNNGITRAAFVIAASDFKQVDLIDSLVGDDTKTFTVTASNAAASFNIFTWVENTSRIRDVTT